MKRSGYGAIVLALAVSVSGTRAWATQDQGYKRWAILACPELQSSGVADLLAAQLSAEPGMELVERQRIDVALKELGLSQSLGDDVRGRMQLGLILKADGLVILSRVTTAPLATQPSARAGRISSGQAFPPAVANTTSFVKVVIADCRQGARLRLEFLPYGSVGVEQVAACVSQVVRQTRRQFASGLQAVIGISHFVCRNFTHDYDQYQAGFAYLLESALTSVPGVAVIETEEARQVQQELDVAGSGLAGSRRTNLHRGRIRSIPADFGRYAVGRGQRGVRPAASCRHDPN